LIFEYLGDKVMETMIPWEDTVIPGYLGGDLVLETMIPWEDIRTP
jgi:hypothetical protein